MKMTRNADFWCTLANDLMDILLNSFGAEWLIAYAVDSGYDDETILEVFIDDEALLQKVKEEQ